MHNLSIFARPSIQHPLLQRLAQSLDAPLPVTLSLVGGPLMGKSTLLSHLSATLAAELSGQNRVVQRINCSGLRPGELPPSLPAQESDWVVLVDNCDQIFRWEAEDRNRWLAWIADPQPTRWLLLASRRPLHEMADASGAGVHLPYFPQNFLGLVDGEEATRLIHSALAAYPAGESLAAPLVEWCGGHPFLLNRVTELLLDVAGLLPAGQPVGTVHLPLLRLRLAAVYGRLLFDSQWRAVECADDSTERPIAGLLHSLLRRAVRFDELSPIQTEPMNWLLVQGVVGIDGHNYRLFSPLFQEYLTHKLQVDLTAVPLVQVDQRAAHALVERESHRFTPQEKTLLLYFLDRPGAIVSVDELLAEVWQRPDGSVRRVQEGIRRLRHRLAELNSPAGAQIGAIENEWGQGYRYVPVNGFG